VQPFRGARVRLKGLVSKRPDRPYSPVGQDWIKVKNRKHHAFDECGLRLPECHADLACARLVPSYIRLGHGKRLGHEAIRLCSYY